MTANQIALIIAIVAAVAVLCVAAGNLEAANQRDGLGGVIRVVP